MCFQEKSIATLRGFTFRPRRANAAKTLYCLAQNAIDGPITPELEAARSDRVLNYPVFMTACELIAALYIMSNQPRLTGSLLTIAIAAAVALVQMALVTRKKAVPRSNVPA